jgi:hypothetical protein
MAGLMSAEEIFEKAQAAAVAATSPDEKALQIDYPALREKIRAALADRKVALCHVNKFLPEGYEEQGRFNMLLLTAGNVVFDIVIGDAYFRYDIVSVGQGSSDRRHVGQQGKTERRAFPEPPPHARRRSALAARARRL